MPTWTLAAEPDREIEAQVKQQVRRHRFNHSPSDLFTPDGDPVDWQALNLYLHDEGRLIGALLGSTQWKTLHVHWLWVDAAQRNRGYAREMINRALEEARRRGCVCAWGTVWQTQGASTLYDKLGAKLMWRQEFPVADHALLFYRYDFE
jgi:GNAT superfamily N-acetyltransferase